MKEAYVTYETAKLLKEKGFDWKCSTYLYTINVYNYGVEPCRFQINDSKNSELASDKMTAPTQQMACRWLREEHKIHIGVFVNEVDKYIAFLDEIPVIGYTSIPLEGTFPTYEDAIEAAIQYVLTNLI